VPTYRRCQSAEAARALQEGGNVSFWTHMFRGFLILLVPFVALFAISILTPWDVFSRVMASDYWLFGVPLFGLVWIAAFFLQRRGNSN
jgi:hypothetical protein